MVINLNQEEMTVLEKAFAQLLLLNSNERYTATSDIAS